MSGTQEKYTLKDQSDLSKFVGNVVASEGKGGIVLDSANTAKVVLDSAKNESGRAVPRVLDELLGKGVDEHAAVKALFDGVNVFTREHGFVPAGDLLLSAIHQGISIFDSATNAHHDQLSLQPNAAIVAILGAFAEATPFAGYLPADKGSNEARLIIVQHNAGSSFGDYAAGGIMDGVAAGGAYLSSSRTQQMTAPNSGSDYKFTFLTTNGGAAVPLLRGRTLVYIAGQVAAMESSNFASSGTVPLSGQVTINSTVYTLTGNVDSDNGIVTVTPSAPLPAGTLVTAEGFIDFEKNSALTPKMGVQASTFKLYASPFRAVYQMTPEARSQFANEVGVDAGAEAMLTVRSQYALERHYQSIAKAKMVGSFVNQTTFNYDYSTQIAQKTRSDIWQNFQSHLGVVSQAMAEATADHGITHLYVTKSVAQQFMSMPTTLFEPSGISARPGIYRVGRLFGVYEVYYTPRGLVEATDGSSAEILAVGRSSQTARCPIIHGDIGAPVFEPLGTDAGLQSGYGFSTRAFTALNPHNMSAAGCALINVTNLK